MERGLYGLNGNGGRIAGVLDQYLFGICGFTPVLGEYNYMVSQTVAFANNSYSYFTCPFYGKGGGVTVASGGYVKVIY